MQNRAEPSLSPVQCKMARVAIGVSLQRMQALTGVQAARISEFERGSRKELTPEAYQIVREFLLRHVILLPAKGRFLGEGVRLKYGAGRGAQESKNPDQDVGDLACNATAGCVHSGAHTDNGDGLEHETCQKS